MIFVYTDLKKDEQEFSKLNITTEFLVLQPLTYGNCL